jgi:hypothetical protein
MAAKAVFGNKNIVDHINGYDRFSLYSVLKKTQVRFEGLDGAVYLLDEKTDVQFVLGELNSRFIIISRADGPVPINEKTVYDGYICKDAQNKNVIERIAASYKCDFGKYIPELGMYLYLNRSLRYSDLWVVAKRTLPEKFSRLGWVVGGPDLPLVPLARIEMPLIVKNGAFLKMNQYLDTLYH